MLSMNDSNKRKKTSTLNQIVEYLRDNISSIVVNCSFAVVVLLVVSFTFFIVSSTAKEDNQLPQQTIVKVYFNDNDSIIPVLKSEMDSLKRKLDSIRNDSISVQISKIQR